MTYQPPHNAVPGSTAYFTIPNIGGFYAPVSRNEPMRRRVDDDSDHDDDEQINHTSRAAMSMPQQPVYGHPSYVQQQHSQMHPYAPAPAIPPQAWNYPGTAMPNRAVATGQPQGQVFNGWKGVPEEKDKDVKDTKDKDRTGSQKDVNEKNESKSKNRRSGSEPVSPWQQLSDRLRMRSEKLRRHSRTANDDSDAECAYDYDVCDTPVRRGRNRSPLDQVTFSESANVKVIIQPYGSARVIVHIDEHGDSGYGHNEDGYYDRHHRDRSNEKMVAFVVSDRCLSMAAKEWPHQCHPGTRTCNIRVSCDEAVIGMYWMLHVLHHAGRDNTVQNSLMGQQRDRQFQQQVALQRYLQQRTMTHSQSEDDDEVEDDDKKNRHSRKKSATGHFVYDYYHGSVGTRAVPIELPPRVLAFALMYAVQFGVVDAWRPGHPPHISRVPASLQAAAWAQAQTGSGQDKGVPQSLATVPDPTVPVPAPAPAPAPSASYTAPPANSDSPAREAFRLAANQWLQSIASTRVNMTMGRLNSVTVPPDDILFALYAGRVLGCPTLLRLCQLTILDRWSIDDMANWFRDGSGDPVVAGEILPPHMAETVSMDLFSLKSARDRSLTKVADLATRLLGGQ